MINISAIVLAAGFSRRMGAANKLLLPWRDITVVAAVAQHLLSAAVDEVIVVTGHQSSEVEKALQSLPVRFIHNSAAHTGLTSSIQKGVSIAGGDGYMICLADMVLITPEEYTLLSSAFRARHLLDDRCIVLPDFQGKTGNPVIFSAAYRSDILLQPETEGCKTLVRSNPGHHLRVAMPSDHVLKDIDYPGDYAALTP
ncbi:MAG TPA: nucleotidyltransferase family protein [Puia sp.]|nr:nucleotidyltransferase family protein [Puia sp.]